MVIMICGIIGIIIGIVLTLRRNKEWAWYILLFSIMLPIGIASITYFKNLDTKGYLESFYFNNASSYQVAVDKTSSYLSQDEFIGKLIAGDIEKFQLSTSISDRIAEWRNSVVVYNEQLRKYQLYKGNIFSGLFMPNLNEDLLPIVIK